MGEWPLIAAAAVLGLLCGSFANVLIARVPHGEDWVRDSSRCPSCRQEIAWYDNVPVLSWLWLRRRCRRCGNKISARYPTVELTVAVLFGLVAWAQGPTVLSLLLAFLAVATVALAAIDFEHLRLPDALVWPSTVVTLVALVVDSALEGQSWPILRAGLGALILGGVYFALWFAAPRGLGFGDVKLALLLGLVLGYLGWDILAVGSILGPVIGMIASLGAIAKARSWRGVRIPYGPWMIAAFWVAGLWGETIGSAYLEWVLG